MNKDISVGTDFSELPSINNSSSSNSSEGGLDKLMKSFNENKLQIVAFLSFFLFIIFTMSLVLGSVDFTDEGGGEKSYSGNKSLDKLYEEAGGNEALSNARMTSKIDLSTDDYSCSYFVEYEGNNKRKVYCTSCPGSVEKDVTKNDEFCRQFVYGDEGDFEYSLLDNEYVSQRRARKENEDDIKFAEGNLPECTRTLVDESKLGTPEEIKGQICTLDTSENEGTNLKAVECSTDDIIRIRDMKYKNKCDCGNFSNTNQVDCNDDNETHKCQIEGENCIASPDTPNTPNNPNTPNTHNKNIENYIYEDKTNNITISISILFLVILVSYCIYLIKSKDKKDILTVWIPILFGIAVCAIIVFIGWREYTNKVKIRETYEKEGNLSNLVINNKDIQVLLVIVLILLFLFLLLTIFIIGNILMTTGSTVKKTGSTVKKHPKRTVIFLIVAYFITFLVYYDYRKQNKSQNSEEEEEVHWGWQWSLMDGLYRIFKND